MRGICRTHAFKGGLCWIWPKSGASSTRCATSPMPRLTGTSAHAPIPSTMPRTITCVLSLRRWGLPVASLFWTWAVAPGRWLSPWRRWDIRWLPPISVRACWNACARTPLRPVCRWGSGRPATLRPRRRRGRKLRVAPRMVWHWDAKCPMSRLLTARPSRRKVQFSPCA